VTIKNEAVVSVRRSPDRNLGFRQLLLLNADHYLASVHIGSIVDGSCLPGFDASTPWLRICPTLFEVSLAPDLDQFGSEAMPRRLKVHLLAL